MAAQKDKPDRDCVREADTGMPARKQSILTASARQPVAFKISGLRVNKKKGGLRVMRKYGQLSNQASGSYQKGSPDLRLMKIFEIRIFMQRRRMKVGQHNQLYHTKQGTLYLVSLRIYSNHSIVTYEMDHGRING